MNFAKAIRFPGRGAVTVLALALAGCGGGGGSGSASAPAQSAPPPPASSTPQPVTTVAPISGFGSVFVAGVEFETDSAEVEVEDNLSSESELALGMRVRVEGSVNDDGVTGSADRVVYEAELVGPVGSTPIVENDGETLRFNAFGVQVVAERTVTSFDGSDPAFSFDTLAQGDIVEVSGAFNRVANVLEATRIELRPPGTTEAIVSGSVENLDAAGTSFTLDGVTVLIDGNTDLTRVDGQLADGDDVRVRGDLQADGSVLATVIRTRRGEIAEAQVAANAEVELEGVIESNDGAGNLVVSGQPVDASNATLSPSGAALSEGRKVEVEGTLRGDVLVASAIKIKAERVRAIARIGEVDTAAMTFALRFGGMDQLLTFAVDTATDIRDRGMDLRIADLRVDDPVRVLATRIDGVLTAEHVRRGNDDRARLQGTATGLDEMAGTVEIEGVSFATDADTAFQRAIDGDDDASITAAEFFAAASIGSVIKAKDRDVDGVAEELEIESETAELRVSRTFAGEVEAIDSDDGSLVVAGENVAIDDDTDLRVRGNRLSRAEFDALIATGARVVVSDTDADGVAERVRIVVPEDGRDVEVTALVDAFDAVTGVITLAGMDFATDTDTAFFIDVSGATDTATAAVEFFARLTQGQSVVEARDIDGDGTLEALVLKGAEGEGEDQLEVSVQGPVDAFDAGVGTLVVDGQEFTTDADTRFKRNVRGDDDEPLSAEAFFAALAVGAVVEVKDEGGDGVADRIELK